MEVRDVEKMVGEETQHEVQKGGAHIAAADATVEQKSGAHAVEEKKVHAAVGKEGVHHAAVAAVVGATDAGDLFGDLFAQATDVVNPHENFRELVPVEQRVLSARTMVVGPERAARTASVTEKRTALVTEKRTVLVTEKTALVTEKTALVTEKTASVTKKTALVTEKTAFVMAEGTENRTVPEWTENRTVPEWTEHRIVGSAFARVRMGVGCFDAKTRAHGQDRRKICREGLEPVDHSDVAKYCRLFPTQNRSRSWIDEKRLGHVWHRGRPEGASMPADLIRPNLGTTPKKQPNSSSRESREQQQGGMLANGYVFRKETNDPFI